MMRPARVASLRVAATTQASRTKHPTREATSAVVTQPAAAASARSTRIG